jgi:hypothetical protein
LDISRLSGFEPGNAEAAFRSSEQRTDLERPARRTIRKDFHHGLIGRADVPNGEPAYQLGLGPSHRDQSVLLDLLEKDGFITNEQAYDYRVIKATQSEIEVAEARVGVDWLPM